MTKIINFNERKSVKIRESVFGQQVLTRKGEKGEISTSTTSATRSFTKPFLSVMQRDANRSYVQ